MPLNTETLNARKQALMQELQSLGVQSQQLAQRVFQVQGQLLELDELLKLAGDSENPTE